MQTSDLTPERLRALAEIRPERGLVLSLYLDLDPREFSAPDARHTAVRSLLSEAEAQLRDGGMEHDEEEALRADLGRAQTFLERDLDADGAHGLALFACGPAGLWETVRLARPVASAVLIDSRPLVEPLAELADATRWGVLLVNRNTARLLRGSRDALEEVGERDDDVHGQHSQGGWSQARYERSVDREAREHVRATAEDLLRQHQRRPFDALLLGCPEEMHGDVEAALHPYLRERLAGRISVDVEHATPDDVLAAAQEKFAARERAHEEEALDRLRAGVGGGGRAVAGWTEVLAALNEKRVEILLLDERPAPGPGLVCPQCGWLGTEGDACPVDGTGLGRRDDICEPAVEAALKQDAEVLRLRHHRDALSPHAGAGAVLRF